VVAQDPLVGSTLAGRFELAELIGEGGSGVVYRARQLSLDRVVAVKVLNLRASSDPAWVQRFHNEARAAARLAHPNTIRLIDFGQTDDGRLFIAMELLHGRSLRHLLEVGPPPTAERALRIVSQICASLAEAHSHGIIHRDIKPENVFIDDQDLVKVLDFSIAKLATPEAQVTRDGAIFGTPEYMSPEQCRGAAVDVRSDLYAVGVVAYELLSGRAPFAASSPTEVVMMHLRAPPPPLPELPEGVAALVLRALAKDPARRPQSASELEAECQVCLAGMVRAEPGGVGSAPVPGWAAFPTAARPLPLSSGTLVEGLSLAKPIVAPPEQRTMIAASDGPEAMAPPPPPLAPIAAAAGAGMIGVRFGAFRCLQLIGEGGMGSVYLAEHDLIGRRAAVKVLRPEFSSNREVLQRFFNEARATTKLKHPGIVEVYDFGFLPDSGHAYLVMEFLDGESLGARLRRERLTPALAVEIARQVARALAAAHAQGLVHRDIKPDNIFLQREPALPRPYAVKLLDFGIAKLAPHEALGEKTHAGIILGTPTYMSPEQCRGAETVDHRADLYSLGCVLFEMLAGRPPFCGEGAGDVIAKHIYEEAPTLASFAPATPPTLDLLVRRMLAKSPDLRPQGMTELSAELDVCLDGDGLVPAAAGNGWIEAAAQLRRSLAAADADVVAELLQSLFGAARTPLRGVLELRDSHVELARAQRFYCVVVGEPEPAPTGGERQLRTVTFTEHSMPLEQHLEALDPNQPKVVLVVTTSPGLSQGVRRKILEYRRRFDAYVLPLFVAEIHAARRRARLPELFRERLDDLHAPIDPFGDVGAKRDRLSFIGMQRELGEVLHALEGRGAAVVVCGRPGSGKSSLLNMVELDSSADFVRIRCASVSERSVDGIVAEVVKALGNRFAADHAALERLPLSKPVEPPASGNIRHTLFVAVPASDTARDETVLVLEDADCLITPLIGDGAEREQACRFWSTVAEWCDRGRIRIVVSGVRASLLRQRRIAAWENPLATHVKVVALLPFAPDVCARYISETALTGALELDDDALDDIYRLSRGHVDVARLLGSLLFQRARRRAGSGFEGVRADRALVAEAAEELAQLAEPFGDALAALAPHERLVLVEVARRQPRSVSALKRQLAGRVAPDRVRDALDWLHKLGLVEHADGRQRITMPLLARWLEHDQDPAHDPDVEPRDLRGMALGLGLGGAFLGVWLWLLLASPQMVPVHVTDGDCSVDVVHDEASVIDAPLGLDVQCRCPGAGRSVRLIALNNMAHFGAQLRESAPLACTPDAPMRSVEVRPGTLFRGERDFRFGLVAGDQQLRVLTVRNDWWQQAKARAKTTTVILAALSGILGSIITFSAELREKLARFGRLFGLVRRRRSDATPPVPPPPVGDS
jgi:serine/threonine protein kinase